MRNGRKKNLYRREKDFLERPNEEVDIQRKALRQGKNLVLGEDARVKQEEIRSKITPRKAGVGLKRRPRTYERICGTENWFGRNPRYKKRPYICWN